jgi:hypothetical protein
MLNRTIPPAFQTLQKVHLPQVQSHALSNGYQCTGVSAGEPQYYVWNLFKAGTGTKAAKVLLIFTVN